MLDVVNAASDTFGLTYYVSTYLPIYLPTRCGLQTFTSALTPRATRTGERGRRSERSSTSTSRSGLAGSSSGQRCNSTSDIAHAICSGCRQCPAGCVSSMLGDVSRTALTHRSQCVRAYRHVSPRRERCVRLYRVCAACRILSCVGSRVARATLVPLKSPSLAVVCPMPFAIRF